jgi:hypothetical protein
MLRYVCLGIALLLPSATVAATTTTPTLDTTNCQITNVSPTSAPDAKKSGKDKSDKDNKMFLGRAVCEVEKALDAYQQSDDVEDKAVLPKLATADFDFKTVVDTKGGFTVSFLIFKFGSTVDKQDTNEVDFQYVPKSLLKTGFEATRKKSLQQELIDTIKSAARAVVEQSEMQVPGKDPLVFKQLSVTISYGVTWDVNGGLNAPISLVTLGPSLDHSKNNVQQVKLVFAPPKPKNGTTGE